MSLWNPLTWFRKKEAESEGTVILSELKTQKDNAHLERRPGISGDSQTLSDMVRGIAHAASAANEIQDQQFIKQIDYYFHKESDGTLVPKVVRAKVGDNNYIEIPLISMIDPSTLGLSEMEVRMGVKLSKSDVKKRLHDVNKDVEVSRSSFSVALTSVKPGERQDVIDITMKFSKVDPAEGSSRLVEEMNGTIHPHKYSKDTKKPDTLTHLFTRGVAGAVSDGADTDTDDFEPHDHDPDESEGLGHNYDGLSSPDDSSDDSSDSDNSSSS